MPPHSAFVNGFTRPGDVRGDFNRYVAAAPPRLISPCEKRARRPMWFKCSHTTCVRSLVRSTLGQVQRATIGAMPPPRTRGGRIRNRGLDVRATPIAPGVTGSVRRHRPPACRSGRHEHAATRRWRVAGRPPRTCRARSAPEDRRGPAPLRRPGVGRERPRHTRLPAVRRPLPHLSGTATLRSCLSRVLHRRAPCVLDPTRAAPYTMSEPRPARNPPP